MKKISLLVCVLLSTVLLAAGKTPRSYTLPSPDGTLEVTVTVDETLSWSLSSRGKLLLAPSAIGLELSDGTVLGGKAVKKMLPPVDREVEAQVYKKACVQERYNAMTLSFKNFDVEFRAYEEGAAYRIVPKVKGPFRIAKETAAFTLPADGPAWIPYVNGSAPGDPFATSFESLYSHSALSAWESGRMAFLPILVQSGDKKLLFTESGLTNYPGMFLCGEGTTLSGVWAPVPKKRVQGGHNNLQLMVQEREDYLACFDRAEPLPWRIVLVAADDVALLESDLPWLLGKAPEGDFSWVRPGKVAWDWWNDWNLYGVPFQAGINNQTYKYYIDFAAANGIEYVILDEGWAVNMKADLFQVVPEIDLQELVDYGKERGVGIILWAGYYAFARDMEKACREYSAMGVKGFKVDFMNADDQLMVDFYTRAAATAARYGLMLDFHGAFKPAGLQRSYPNVINFEGVYGLENMKWQGPECDEVTYDVTIPFIRNVAGQMDYTQGAMHNAGRGSYRASYSEPMSQGTRCRQLAEYTVFFAPLTMLCDSPSNYLQEPECTAFIASVPTVWDKTVGLCGAVGEYVAVARRSGDSWYVGALTDWQARDLELDLSFLGDGPWQLDIFEDGPNAVKAARDYTRRSIPVPASRRLKIHMAPGGGWTAHITRAK